jgi:hypothetical protein
MAEGSTINPMNMAATPETGVHTLACDPRNGLQGNEYANPSLALKR